MVGDFPIDLFLLHPGSNYVRDPSQGAEAHKARVQAELFLGQYPHQRVNDFYSALASVGLGRNLTAFLTPAREKTPLEHEGAQPDGSELDSESDDASPKRYLCMPRSKLCEKSFCVRAIQPEHIESVRRWRNAQTEVLRQESPITSAEQREYYRSTIWPEMHVERPENLILAFEEDGRLVGYGGLVHVAWIHGRAEVSFLLDPDLNGREYAYAEYFATFLRLVKTLAFDDLMLRRLFTETFAMREHHISVLESCGFRREGVLRQHVRVAGRPVDSIFHGCLATDDR